MASGTESEKKHFYRRNQALKTTRSSWMTQWEEISSNLLPRKGRFFVTDKNRARDWHNEIYDSTGTKALRTLSAGMMAGMTSPARPWFRLATPDADLNEYQAVKEWLDKVTKVMRMVFAKSNTYDSLHSMYEELGAFGTGFSLIVPNYKNIVHNHTLTAGEYCIASNELGHVDTVYREFQFTVDQMVREFGLENCSMNVQEMYRKGLYEKTKTIIHGVEMRPQDEREPGKRDNKNMPYRSIYFEQGSEAENKPRRESGFELFPGVGPRWNLMPGDDYGVGPDMDALGDIKQLQREQLTKGIAIDYQGNPPIQAPASMKDSGDFLPGGVSFYDSLLGPNDGVRSAFNVPLDVGALLEDIRDIRGRIHESFYADLFRMLSNTDRRQITAREVQEKHEEKLLMLGPVLERLHSENLDPRIDIVFDAVMKAGILPEPPQELQGKELRVEYVSVLAQAQKAVGTGSIDRLLGVVGNVSQFKPQILDKIDEDQIADVYSDLLGVDPSLIVADEKVAIIRQNRMEQQQQQAQMQAMAEGVNAAKTMSETNTEGKNALTDVVGK